MKCFIGFLFLTFIIGTLAKDLRPIVQNPENEDGSGQSGKGSSPSEVRLLQKTCIFTAENIQIVQPAGNGAKDDAGDATFVLENAEDDGPRGPRHVRKADDSDSDENDDDGAKGPKIEKYQKGKGDKHKKKDSGDDSDEKAKEKPSKGKNKPGKDNGKGNGGKPSKPGKNPQGGEKRGKH